MLKQKNNRLYHYQCDLIITRGKNHSTRHTYLDATTKSEQLIQKPIQKNKEKASKISLKKYCKISKNKPKVPQNSSTNTTQNTQIIFTKK